jgi:predicted GH43/DUF377 family glycosyl hydrolase
MLRLAQVAITSISVKDFLDYEWNWRKRVYPFARVDSKNCALLPKKFGGKYAAYHRIPPHIWIAYTDSLEDWSHSYHRIVMRPEEEWECIKIGAAGPPIDIDKGWLLIYHGVDDNFTYRLGAALISKDDPEAAARSRTPVLEPVEEYEQNIVFSCGAVLLDGKLFLYYGADDRTICIATCDVSEILHMLESNKKRQGSTVSQQWN